MKNFAVIALCWLLTGCNYAARHPVRTKVGLIAIGAGTAVAVALATRHTCPHTINGYPYDGTPPCPNSRTYDPGARH